MILRMQIRPAAAADVEAIRAIVNHYIEHTPTTFEVEPYTLERRREWFAGYADSGRYRVLVAEEGGRVLGYASSSRYHPRPAYQTSVEDTVLLRPDAVGRGLGTALLRALLAALDGEDVHRVYARIVLPNEPSVRLHSGLGFRTVGVEEEVGWKLGRYWSVQVMERPGPA